MKNRYLSSLTKEEWQSIEDLYRQHEQVKVIASMYRVNAHTLGDALKERLPEVQGRVKQRRLDSLSQSEWDQIVGLYKEGTLYKDIARLFCVSTTTLAKKLKNMCPEIDLNLLKTYNTPGGLVTFNKRDDWEPIYARHMDGESIKDLSRSLGIPRSAIKRAFIYHRFDLPTKEEYAKRRVEFARNACMSRYGGDSPFHDASILQKSKDTLLKNYGVTNPGQSDVIKKKISETCQKKYGVNWTTQAESVKNKARQTCVDRYDVPYYTQTEDYKQRAEQTCLERYGVPYFVQSQEMYDKTQATCLERYGVPHFTQTDKYRQESHERQVKESEQDLLDRLERNGLLLLHKYDGQRFKKTGEAKYYDLQCKNCGHTFRSAVTLSCRLLCPKCYPNASSFEIEVLQYIRAIYDGEIIEHYRVENKEIDIYLPELKLGFEINGTYWHNALKKSKNYHKYKTELMLQFGIRVIHVWDYYEHGLLFSRIKTLIGSNKKVYARQTDVTILNRDESKQFFNGNHLDGYTPSIFTIALRYGDGVVCAMSFRKHAEGLEIARFATKQGVTVVSGFSKLMKHALDYLKQGNILCNKIISYCDRDWTPYYEQSVYYKYGFTCLGDSSPMLKYYNFRTNKVIARQQLQKHKLKELFPKSFDEKLTANQILEKEKIYPLYNSGNWKFVLNLTDNKLS